MSEPLDNSDITLNNKPGKYRLLRELSYDRIVPFVFENIGIKTFAARSYFAINLLNLILILYFLLPGNLPEKLPFREFLVQFLTGLLAGSIFVIPFHEAFHALAYKLAGAPKIHFGMDLQQMIFYVSADHFIIDRKSFYYIAMAPFVMINVIAVLLFLYSGFIPLHSLLFFLLFHNIMCIGDFAMISFFQRFPDKELLTYDDLKGKVSYIFEKITE